ncbi:hypothetical protein ACOMHN_053477 [Nucella lapillus]
MDTPPSDSSSSTPGRQGDEDHSTVPPLPSPQEIPFLSDGMSPAGPEVLHASSPRESAELEQQLSGDQSEMSQSLREMEADKAAWSAFDQQQRHEDMKQTFEFRQQFAETGQSLGEDRQRTVEKLRRYRQQREETMKQWLVGSIQQRARVSQRMRFARQRGLDSLREERADSTCDMLESASRRCSCLRGYGNETPYESSFSRALQSPYSSGQETGGMGRRQRRAFCAMEELTMELSALQVQQSSVKIQEPRTAKMKRLQRRTGWITRATRGGAAAAQQEEVVHKFHIRALH